MQNEWNESSIGTDCWTTGPFGRDKRIRDESSTCGHSSIFSMVSIFPSAVVANSDICEKSFMRSLCCRTRLFGVISGDFGVDSEHMDGVDASESMADGLVVRSAVSEPDSGH